ncbi:YbhB/YbcL family Raf kinase inhibitor-like protein [Cardiobacterium hominis]|uniref:YbhB/YbcL family Raf kinase inhibitor-like protein n=1 Tax=Cardiobacterium hominis TaxID=2718 RepID=UPI0028D8A8AB|nr:YbhB/YbcL family Raf kinase inhibitor-like protein [Cardiobacterium hominis]
MHWANPPAGTKSFALSCYDPDAPTGSGFWHWYIINLPADTRSLDENAAASGLPADARHARNDYGDYNYGGACPPPGHGTHRYIFTIHALDCEHLDLPEDTTTARVGFNVWAHSLGSASLTGTFSR